MRIYNISPITGEFVSMGDADESPLEPGVWLIPAWAVEKAPPKTGERKVAVYRDGKWSIADDWRGYQYWAEGDRNAHIISEIGEKPPKGHLPEKPPLSAEEVKELRATAYATPLTGSDCLFAESTRMQVMGENDHEEVRARAIARFKEIQAQYPWPAK